ncbi:gp436 family protein [Parathalassolituus penaei]|uniref:DUF1320 family protein n=1 Tax=Parathalassolituus penaei TaxID=2997323 RepID=A0A9X3ENX9_9GAMM|nr:phage protein Gp36 family protein [Parathalassolituus penaei]MCY0966133.1 DUF1320 family protein [Parathalassolituus penaei]
MAYATATDLVSRFGELELLQLTDTDNSGQLGNSQIDSALADASDEIDSYLAGRYALPLATIPTLLVAVCADVSRYYLYGAAVPELVRERYQERIKFLVRVASGTASLPIPEAANTSTDADGIEISSDGHDWRRGSGAFGV